MDRLSSEASVKDSASSDPSNCDRPHAGGLWGPLADADASEQTRWLARTIETEIVPRLMLVHRGAHAASGGPAPAQPDAQQVEEFALLALGADAEATRGHVRRLRAAGMALETIYLHLLAPAARHLGAMWEADLCGFSEVTLGLWRLQQVMHDLGPVFQDDAECRLQTRRAILVPVPGSQHTLGLFMVSEFFRRAGWQVWGDATVSTQEIVSAARKEWFDIVGFSVGSETHVATLASVILEVRKASRNRGLVVLIGGPIVNATPGLTALVGADASAEDAPRAVQQAESLVAERLDAA
jgi:methanogenic corrinoid protein MtbC1